MTKEPDRLTQLLADISAGDEQAEGELYDMVYEELHGIAARFMQRERPGHTLQPTALVHEAFLRLLPSIDAEAPNRAYFFAAAANAMRRVLVEHARKRAAKVHGGDMNRVFLDEVLDTLKCEQKVDVLALDESLEQLQRCGERQYQVVMLRFFGGMTYDEVAEHLQVSVSTAEKDWQMARAWLRRQLRSPHDDA